MHKKPPTVDPANPTSAEKLDQEATARVNAIGASVLSVLLDHEGRFWRCKYLVGEQAGRTRCLIVPPSGM